jgi:hypothetical protein
MMIAGDAIGSDINPTPSGKVVIPVYPNGKRLSGFSTLQINVHAFDGLASTGGAIE